MVRAFLHSFVRPNSTGEDMQRQELVLNIVLLGCLILSLTALAITVIDFLVLGESYRGSPPQLLFLVLLIFGALYIFSRDGFVRLASYLLLGIFFTIATLVGYQSGMDLPLVILTYTLVIIMSGVVAGRRFAILSFIGSALALFGIGYFQSQQLTIPASYWRLELLNVGDLIAIVAGLGVVSTISWLYSREIEVSLFRARASETALKHERDHLEVAVEARTAELKQVQLEKMLHLYRFAEFGRLASGFFHDLINPLNTVSLNLEQLQSTENGATRQFVDNTKLIRRAIDGTKRIEKFVQAAQNQIKQQSEKLTFSVQQELAQVIQVLDHKAKELGVNIASKVTPARQQLHNDPVKFNQLMTNLISNAIDSYRDKQSMKRKQVLILIAEESGTLIITVQDYGCGIPPDRLSRIFEPFFTTKASNNGMGLGLAITKDTAEKDFKGSVSVESTENAGSIFTVSIPIEFNQPI